MINGELIVDNFAGGGGASTGIEEATGYCVDIAINHDPEAIKMHKANHPYTKHYCEDVWQVDPVKVCGGHPVALAWFSPDCKHFRRAVQMKRMLSSRKPSIRDSCRNTRIFQRQCICRSRSSGSHKMVCADGLHRQRQNRKGLKSRRKMIK